MLEHSGRVMKLENMEDLKSSASACEFDSRRVHYALVNFGF